MNPVSRDRSSPKSWGGSVSCNRDVYRRHEFCRCVVEFVPVRGGKKQDVYSKRWKDEDAVEERKNTGLNGGKNDDRITPAERSVRAEYRLSATTGDHNEATIRTELGRINPEDTERTLAFFRDEIRDKETEHAIVIDKAGNVVHFDGGDKTVSVFDVDLDGAHILHNHPASNGILSFGEDDFSMIREHPDAIYDLVNSEYDYHLEVLKDISGLTYSEISKIDVSVFDLNEANDDFQHIVMQRLNDEGYIKYERKRK